VNGITLNEANSLFGDAVFWLDGKWWCRC